MALRQAVSASAQSQSSQNFRSQRGLGLGEVGSGAGRVRGRVPSAWPHVERRSVSVNGASCVRHGQARPRKRVVRIQRNRLGEELEGPSGRRRRELVPEIPAAKVQVVRLHLARLSPLECAHAVRRQTDPNLVSDGRTELALELEHARRLAIEGGGPICIWSLARISLDMMRSRPPSARRELSTRNSASQFDANLGQRFRRAFVGHHRGAADHSEVLWVHQAERRDHFLGKAVRQIFAIGIGRKIVKRQHRQLHPRWNLNGTRAPPQLPR